MIEYTGRWTQEDKQRLVEVIPSLSQSEIDVVNADYWNIWGRKAQTPYLDRPNDSWSFWLAIAGRGWGKMLDINTPILTEKGWKKNGELVAGDRVFDEQGNLCNVLIAHDFALPERAYRVNFSDGTYLDAGGEHLWVTLDHLERKKINREGGHLPDIDWANKNSVNTDHIFATQTYSARGDRSHCIPLTKPLIYPKAELPIDPYVLGIWLGDGDNSGAVITSPDEFIVNEIKQRGYKVTRHSSINQDACGRYCIGSKASMRCKITGRMLPNDSMTSRLKDLNLIKNKHIPDVYITADAESRLALLRGLMDSDGYAEKNGSGAEFSSTRIELANGVMQLARSLGQKPILASGRATLYGKDCGPKYRVTFKPTIHVFSLPRKRDRIKLRQAQDMRNHHRMITKVERIELKMMRCITVDSPNSMYLAGEALIPTHNTSAGVHWVLWEIIHATKPLRICVVAATASDLEGTIICGPSGFIANCPKFLGMEWQKGHNWLVFNNGCQVRMYTAESPSRLRGPNFDLAWLDELAAWPQIEQNNVEAIDQVLLSTRLPVAGGNRIAVTTTPKNFKWLRDKLEEAKHNPRIMVSRGSTFDNAANLGASFIENVKQRFEGTPLGLQELSGELIDLGGVKPVREEDIKTWDPHKQVPDCAFVLASLDPAFTERTSGDPSAVWVLGVFWNTEMHDYCVIVLDVWQAHLAYPDLKDRMLDVWEESYAGNEIQCNMLLIEQKGSGMSITQDLNRMGITTRGYNPGRDDKFARISKGASVIQQGRFYVMGSFPGSKSRYAPWVEEAIDQVVNFPSTEHDDFVDSLSQALIYLIDSGFVCEYPGRRPLSPDMLDKESRQSSSRRSGNPYSM